MLKSLLNTFINKKPFFLSHVVIYETELPRYLKRQCFAYSAASEAVHSFLGLSFMSSHHSSLPTSGVQAINIKANESSSRALLVLSIFTTYP